MRALSQRQREALAQAASGVSALQGAKNLGVGLYTYKDHLSMARLKLFAYTTAQAVAIATKKGLI